MKPLLIATTNNEKIRLMLWRRSFAYWRNKTYSRVKRKKPPIDKRVSLHTKRGRDAAVARHRAVRNSRSPAVKRDIGEMIASLSPKERAALVASPHVIAAVEKILEAMLFRFS
jgi:hypothetical protein